MMDMTGHATAASLGEESKPAPGFYSSPSFNEAVNTSRFVNSFGITSLIYALFSITGLNLLGGAIGGGVGLFIWRYGEARFYRVLGTLIVVFAFAGVPFPGLGSGVLSAAILMKGTEVLRVLSKEGKNSNQWLPSRKRAILGTSAACFGLLISVLVLFLVGIATLVRILSARVA